MLKFCQPRKKRVLWFDSNKPLVGTLMTIGGVTERQRVILKRARKGNCARSLIKKRRFYDRKTLQLKSKIVLYFKGRRMLCDWYMLVISCYFSIMDHAILCFHTSSICSMQKIERNTRCHNQDLNFHHHAVVCSVSRSCWFKSVFVIKRSVMSTMFFARTYHPCTVMTTLKHSMITSLDH